MTPETLPSTPNRQLIALTPALGDISFAIGVSMSIGRQDSNDVVLATPQISRQHAKFNQIGNSLFIQDLGSSNGTFVNGERIGTQAVEIQPNDEIAFADLVFMVSNDVAVMTVTPHTTMPTSENGVADLVKGDVEDHAVWEKVVDTSPIIADGQAASAVIKPIDKANITTTAETTSPVREASPAITQSNPTAISTDTPVITPVSDTKPLVTTPVTKPVLEKKSRFSAIVSVLIVLILIIAAIIFGKFSH